MQADATAFLPGTKPSTDPNIPYQPSGGTAIGYTNIDTNSTNRLVTQTHRHNLNLSLVQPRQLIDKVVHHISLTHLLTMVWTRRVRALCSDIRRLPLCGYKEHPSRPGLESWCDAPQRVASPSFLLVVTRPEQRLATCCMRSKCCATGRLEGDNVWLEGKRVDELFEGKQHVRIIANFDRD